MKTTIINQGAFQIRVQNDRQCDMPWTWVILLHDEVLDIGHNFHEHEALEDSEAVLQEFVDDELSCMVWEGDL